MKQSKTLKAKWWEKQEYLVTPNKAYALPLTKINPRKRAKLYRAFSKEHPSLASIPVREWETHIKPYLRLNGVTIYNANAPHKC